MQAPHKKEQLPQGFPLLKLSGKLPFHTHNGVQLDQGITVIYHNADSDFLLTPENDAIYCKVR